MDRLTKFRSYREHPWLKKAFKKLANRDVELAESFILANDSLGRDDFEKKVNRMFLDQPSKPASYTLIMELLANSNS